MWLSNDMASALAATGRPLEPADIVRAADELALARDMSRVITDLLRRSPDLLAARSIVEALQAVGQREPVGEHADLAESSLTLGAPCVSAG